MRSTRMRSQRWINCEEDEDEVDVEEDDEGIDEMVKDESDAFEEKHGDVRSNSEKEGDNYGRCRWFPEAVLY